MTYVREELRFGGLERWTIKGAEELCRMRPHHWWSGNKCYESCYNTASQCGNHVSRNPDGSCDYKSRVCARGIGERDDCAGMGSNKPGVTPCWA